MNYRVLIVDDEESIRKLIQNRLNREGYEVVTAANFDEAYAIFGQAPISVVVTDLKMPGKDGFSLIEYFKPKSPMTKFVVITGHGEKDAAIRSIRLGASDYVEKPFDVDDLFFTIRRCHREYTLDVENKDLMMRLEARLERSEPKTETLQSFTSQSVAMAKTYEWLSVLKRESLRTDAEEPTVLILGESGTGKEMLAKQIFSKSRRANAPWVAVNCANFSEALLESELFGHERGSFSGAQQMKRGLFEIAKGGTLFLDEIGEMDPKVQAKILRVLQEKTFRRVGGLQDLTADVRIIAATHAKLMERVQQGSFREDLYHRLSKLVLELPPLRERKEDLVPMAVYFAQSIFKSRAKEFPGFTSDAEDAIRIYSWPGNVRELSNVIERVGLVYIPGSGAISPQILNLPTGNRGGGVVPFARPQLSVLQGGRDSTAGTGEGNSNNSALLALGDLLTSGEGYMVLKKKWVDSFEKEYLKNILGKHEGNVSAAAREARLDRSNFLRLLRRHAIKAAVFRGEDAAAESADSAQTDMPKAA